MSNNKSTYDYSYESDDNTEPDFSFFSGANPTEPGNLSQKQIPKYTKEDEEYEYEQDEANYPPIKKAPPYKDEDEEKDTRKKSKRQSNEFYNEDEEEDEEKNTRKKINHQSEEYYNEDEEEDEEKDTRKKLKQSSEEYYNEDDNEGKDNDKSTSSHPNYTISEKFTTSNLLPSNNLDALANVSISSSSDDSANFIDQYKINKQKNQEEKQKQKQKKQQKQVRPTIESSYESQSDTNYDDNDEDIKSHSSRRKDEFSRSQASRKSRNVNADNESRSSKRHLNATFANINNDDNFIDNDYDQDQGHEIRRRHSAKSIAPSHKSFKSTAGARSTKSIRSNRSARTNQTNQATSKRSLRSRRSITKDTWKEDVSKSVAQKESDRIDIILQTQYHINPEELEIDIQEKVKKEYEDMVAKHCKVIYQNKEMLNEKISKKHYLDLENSPLKKYSRSEIVKINEQISQEIENIQEELVEVLAENKKIQKKINKLQANRKEKGNNRTKK